MCVCVCVLLELVIVFLRKKFLVHYMNWNWLKNINRVIARPVYTGVVVKNALLSFQVASGMQNY